MFTGIIETLGEVKTLEKEDTNLHITVRSTITPELKIDQSVSHNGVCLTVVAVKGDSYTVTAIDETLQKTNLAQLTVGDQVNLERAMILGSRLDGHIVQGHVDQIGTCTKVEEKDGSWLFSFEYDATLHNPTIEKGSITIDGTSLTVINSGTNTFSVAIIPYTYKHTRFNTYKKGTVVNLEFDVIGKYVAKLTANRL
ncbi:riboflavin synthase [Cellulophaga sp. E16_2]|uniref:Riboflavin synthase n=1 Tax=Cellulophaga algicola (strain DSM 14237 / IC166 / ACAM 630) TaxID=688270 RepID=E6X8R3_CELAD|nr:MULTISPECIES: riboflavin synthase [Cellulophaga]ADV48658.1 riboflavin synthase, alpha subunit [Cellulophaga algicola DSM 14237]MBO0591112.1 riboflavin synthase [Cellulophaga sp. E16_2]